ncbi:MAG TPA: CoA transferase [Alphaproteobacteria bacterium]|nr:CoA transferase [Alphaproteobacteria bacterium]
MDQGEDFARDYARTLLTDLGIAVSAFPATAAAHPAIAWALSGAMALTGHRDGAPVMCPAPLAACAEGALMALAHCAGRGFPSNPGGARLLGERAAITGYGRNGPVSAGGSCRFIEAEHGWIALNLAREDDWRMLPALFEQAIEADWSAVAAAARNMSAGTLVARGRELGLAVAAHRPPGPVRPWHEVMLETGHAPRRNKTPVVVELASLWAGPLCGDLLGLAGARVIKVEGAGRPDGGRFGPPAFFDLLNANKDSVALDLTTAQGREQLRALIRSADIVIEGSRPRALEQLGISAAELVGEREGLTWVGITGYGRTGEAANWIAYGDDAGVAAGLSTLLPDGPIFCSDAVGDPLTGLHAALAAYARWQSGQGGLVSIAIRDVVRHCMAFAELPSVEAAHARAAEWQRILDAAGIAAAPPSAREPSESARPLGADTESVLREFGVAC